MKKVLAVVAVLLIIVAVVAAMPQKSSKTDFLRIHIRADSNSAEDQNVKYVVKNAVVEYLAPFLTEATSKTAAMKIVNKQLRGIKTVCDSVLRENGKNYVATVKLCEEQFPDRCYNGVTLEAGVYDALIIELGSGSGNNWWCVVYPPLCFVEGTPSQGGITYKSKLLEIIQNWKNNGK